MMKKMIKEYEILIKSTKLPIFFTIKEKTINKAQKLEKAYIKKRNIDKSFKTISNKIRLPSINKIKKSIFIHIVPEKIETEKKILKNIKLKKVIITNKEGRKTNISTFFIENENRKKSFLFCKDENSEYLNYLNYSKKLNERMENESIEIKNFLEAYIDIRVIF